MNLLKFRYQAGKHEIPHRDRAANSQNAELVPVLHRFLQAVEGINQVKGACIECVATFCPKQAVMDTLKEMDAVIALQFLDRP